MSGLFSARYIFLVLLLVVAAIMALLSFDRDR